MRAMMGREDPPTEVLSRAFGPLEVQVLEAIWRSRRLATVRDLHAAFPGFAYTTLMTTLDRLHKKGVLLRTKISRAFAYEPRFTRHELEMRLAARSVEQLLGAARGRGTMEPLLSCFVDAVSERDRLLLDDLERLLKAKRAGLSRGDAQ
jgi:predicted transcriptional regulator